MSDAGGPGLDERHLEALRERVRNSAFRQWVGLELVSLEQGSCEIALTLEPHHFNPQGIVHGGIIGTLADTAIGLAVRTGLRPGLTHRTAQLNVHFLSKGEGARLVGLGRSLHVGQRMGYGEGEVLDQQGRLLARASATFIVLPAPGAF
ncbi:MAG TPA: PaaI family thioesterase [Actinomycetota bacterium]